MKPISKRKYKSLSETREFWGWMNIFERSEQVISMIIVIVLWRLIRDVVVTSVMGALNPLDQTVFLIAQLALVGKFIILDLKSTEAMQVFALGFFVLVLAVAYWLLRERERIEGLD